MLKGIVMEVKKDHLIMMTNDGQFCKGKLAHLEYQIGQETFFELYEKVSLTDKLKSFVPNPKLSVGLASMMIFFLAFFPIMQMQQSKQVAAVVNIDINPSVELEVNHQGEVIDLHSLNEDGKDIVNTIEEWEDKSVEEVAENVINVSEQLGYLKDDKNILVTTTIIDDSKNDLHLEDKVDEFVNELNSNEEIQAISVKATKQDYQSAEKEGVSVGKYLIQQKSEENGVSLTKEQVQNSSINELVKAVPNVNELVDEKQLTKYENTKKTLEKIQKTNEEKEDDLEKSQNKIQKGKEKGNGKGQSLEIDKEVSLPVKENPSQNKKGNDNQQNKNQRPNETKENKGQEKKQEKNNNSKANNSKGQSKKNHTEVNTNVKIPQSNSNTSSVDVNNESVEININGNGKSKNKANNGNNGNGNKGNKSNNGNGNK